MWTRARNQCAYPSCIQALTIDAEPSGSGSIGVTVVGEEAHIRAQSVGGPRYDASYEDIDGYDNLILLCPTHHTMIDANNGAGYTVEALVKMKADHERNQERSESLKATLRAYLGDRFAAEDSVQFHQVDLRGPSVDAMFVDVPVGCRRDGSALADRMRRLSELAPGDTAELERTSGFVVTGATQVLLDPEWTGNAVLVGGPGQGKSTVLQYVCQFHRARRLDEVGYAASQSLGRNSTTAIIRFPVRVDLRKYAQWAVLSHSSLAGKKGKPKRISAEAERWRSLEEYIVDDIGRHIGANKFTPHDLVLLLATEPVLLALDGLDEVASLPARARVTEEIVRMRGRLGADAADLVILIATRPGTSLQPLTATGHFPVLHLQRLTPGLRLQYLDQWSTVSGLASEAAVKLRAVFLDSQHIPHVNELASYPMQLAILLHLLYRRQLLPQQRTDLYAEYLKTFLDREQTEDKEPLLADKRRVVEDTHAYLGWYLQAKAEEGQSAGSITRAELQRLLRTYLAGRPKEQELADELYSAITDRVLCLVERDDAFEFEVQSLREYFAAMHIFENLTPKGDGNSRDDGLNALLERPYWGNVCRFFIGKLAKGEVRGLTGNFKAVEKKISPHPLVRAMAVTVLNDRIYDGLTGIEIRDVANFIFDGPGVVLAQDGVLDPSGSPLRLGEEAGRAEAIDHLKARLQDASTDAVRDSAAQSLAAHASPEDNISAWWWERFDTSSSWLDTAAHLRALSSLTPAQTTRLKESLVRLRPDMWPTDILLSGEYDGSEDTLAKIAVASLNEGSVELVGTPNLGTDTEALASYACHVAEGPYATALPPAIQNESANRSLTSARIAEALKSLQLPPQGSFLTSDWERYLSVAADIWGDGWILRRVVSMTPNMIDLGSIATRTQTTALSAAARAEADFRDNKADSAWWEDFFASTTQQRDISLGVLALLETAKSQVLVELAPTLNRVVRDLQIKRFRALEKALQRAATTHRVRALDLHEALRLRRVKMSGRVLWLISIIATDSTREWIPMHLETDLQDVFLAGTTEGHAVVAAAQTSHKLKVDMFKYARGAVQVDGWTGETRLASMSLKMAEAILQDPGQWPAELVQLAVERLSIRAASRTRPLAEIAALHKWFN
ncbi:HNH endonuclease [Arthrobacter sp. NPDC056727]|uniref:HNH endonuclease n=1 Tax=Arthrobacter sp. NPDC056727 TaxID=3345927 RepID=UPI00366C38D0